MLDGSTDRFLDFFDRSRSKIGLILLGFMVMVPLGLLGIDSVGKSSDRERLYPISGSSDSGRDGDSVGLDGASNSGLDVESSENSPSGPSKRRSGSNATSMADGEATGGQSSMVDNNVTTLGPERLEPIGPDDLTLDSSGVGSTVTPPTTKKPVTTRRKAKTATTRRRATTARRRTTTTKRRTTTTKRRTTTTKRRATTTRKPTTVAPATVVVGPQPTLGPPPPTALLDLEPPSHIDK